MGYVVFDCETNGLFDFKLPADHYSQPRLASIAFIETDDDFNVIKASKHYIKPDGWRMPPEAYAVNKLSTEFLEKNGIDINAVLDIYEAYVRDGQIIGAFNSQFDCKVMRAELRRAGRDDLFDITNNTCAMRGTAAYLKEQGISRRPFVSLRDACKHFGITLENAHDAMSDAEAARLVFKELKKVGYIIDPAVHYAPKKNYEVEISADEGF